MKEINWTVIGDAILKIIQVIRGQKKAPAPMKPEIKRYTMTAGEVTVELGLAGIQTLYRRLDSNYVYTDEEGWIEVIAYIYTNEEMPEYFVNPDGTWNVDCEEFAIWFKAMVSKNFGLNYCGIQFGTMRRGEHAFTLLRNRSSLKLFEPQPAEDLNHPFALNARQYKPREVLV